MEGRFEELATGAAAEGGKPLIDSRVEVSRAIEGLRRYVAKPGVWSVSPILHRASGG